MKNEALQLINVNLRSSRVGGEKSNLSERSQSELLQMYIFHICIDSGENVAAKAKIDLILSLSLSAIATKTLLPSALVSSNLSSQLDQWRLQSCNELMRS